MHINGLIKVANKKFMEAFKDKDSEEFKKLSGIFKKVVSFFDKSKLNFSKSHCLSWIFIPSALVQSDI